MRETVRSLRAYFIVLGLLSGVMNLLALAAQPPNMGTLVTLIGPRRQVSAWSPAS